MSAVALPPLDRSEAAPAPGERVIQAAIVLVLHLLPAYAVLYLSVKNELIQLPPSISVRLLPLAEDTRVEPAKPLPPPPKSQPQLRRAPPVQSQPVLAVNGEAMPSSSFVVPPQPAAQPAAPAVAPPAPPALLVAARFDADYLHNPKPAYPPASRRSGEEGKVLLKVRVSAQGMALDVAVSKSSGFGRLDNAAAEAVARWRFVPAKRGEEAVESSVIVPITFALE